LIDKELVGVRQLWDQRLVSLPRLTTLQRESARLLGERGQLTAELDDIAVLVLPVVEESEVGANVVQRHVWPGRFSIAVVLHVVRGQLKTSRRSDAPPGTFCGGHGLLAKGVNASARRSKHGFVKQC